MKKYIASYTDSKDKNWDVEFYANNYAEARTEARYYGREYGYGKLNSVRLCR